MQEFIIILRLKVSLDQLCYRDLKMLQASKNTYQKDLNGFKYTVYINGGLDTLKAKFDTFMDIERKEDFNVEITATGKRI